MNYWLVIYWLFIGINIPYSVKLYLLILLINIMNTNTILKIIIVGDAGVGKSAIFARYFDNIYDEHYPATIGVDFRSKYIINKADQQYQIFVWDIAGRENYRPITTTYYNKSDIVILVYDISNPITVINIEKWVNEIYTYLPENTHQMYLVGNKCDKDTLTDELNNRIDKICEKYNMYHMIVSAKNNNNIDMLFNTIISKTPQLLSRENINSETLILKTNINKDHRVKCCILQ